MEPRPFVIEERVRWSDVDAAGIIFYGAYVRFFELAETELFRAAGLTYGEFFDRFDMFLPRVQVHAEFHRPARLDDVLRVAAHVGHVGRRSITLNFDVTRDPSPRLIAEGHLVLVATDRETLKPKPLPAEFVRLLEPFTLPVEPARRALGIREDA